MLAIIDDVNNLIKYFFFRLQNVVVSLNLIDIIKQKENPPIVYSV